jgi:uncharacterized protein (UPF0264 family)
MPKLLVSVRSAHEASLALAAGVELIDIKEPAAGALGAASLEVIEDILSLVNGRVQTSAACGELIESAADIARRLSGAGTSGTGETLPDYVKVGLAGCGSMDNWPQKWREFVTLLPRRSLPVAVIYADWRAADAPRPADVIQQAKTAKRAAVLIDTFDKNGPGLLRLFSIEQVRALIDEAHELGMPVAVAGQLTYDDALTLALLGPDYIGVRGGVCYPDRNGQMDGERLMKWRSMAAYSADARQPSKDG